MDDGGNVDAIYLNFSKCFTSVPHERLLMKLEKYGVMGKLWSWIADFMRGRLQQVSIRGCLSALAEVLSGIPHRECFRTNPIFIIFVNEMPDMVHSCIQMLTDDTELYTQIRDEEDVSKLQRDVDRLQERPRHWQLKSNPDKCKVLHLGWTNQQKVTTCRQTQS